MKLVGVGVGPGDPELITLKAARLLARVPLVFHPSHGLARSIAADHLDESRQELVPIRFPLEGGDAAGRLIISRLRAHREAACLTEGDPLLYGSFLTVAQAVRRLEPAVELSVIPGVSSFSAAAARVGLPLARGEQRLAIVTGGDARLEEALHDFDTVAILKPARALGAVLAALERAGRTSQAVLITRCGLPGETMVTDVARLAASRADYFSLVLVGRRW